jgi:hypothetical protein
LSVVGRMVVVGAAMRYPFMPLPSSVIPLEQPPRFTPGTNKQTQNIQGTGGKLELLQSAPQAIDHGEFQITPLPGRAGTVQYTTVLCIRKPCRALGEGREGVFPDPEISNHTGAVVCLSRSSQQGVYLRSLTRDRLVRSCTCSFKVLLPSSTYSNRPWRGGQHVIYSFSWARSGSR